MAAANQAPTLIDYAAQLVAGTSAILALSFGGDPAAANRTGFYGDLTAASEKIAMVVGGQTGPIWTRNGSVVDVVNNGALSAASLTATGLSTTTRVVFTTTGGLLTSGAGLTYNANAFVVGDGLGQSSIGVNGASGSARYVEFRTAGSARWRLTRASNSAESGSK
jgi:hypothetical protein